MLSRSLLLFLFTCAICGLYVTADVQSDINAFNAGLESSLNVMKDVLLNQLPEAAQKQGEAVVQYTQQALDNCRKMLVNTTENSGSYKACSEKEINDGWFNLKALFAQYASSSSSAGRLIPFAWL